MQHLILEKLQIKNLRCIKVATIGIDDYTCFVGPNGAGKSTVLYALNVFFRESQNVSTGTLSLSKEDFFRGITDENIEIILSFKVTSDAAREALAHYVQGDRLVIHAVAAFDVATGTAPVVQHGIRKGIPAFSKYRERASSKAPMTELTPLYDGLRVEFPALGAAANGPNRAKALDDFEASHAELLQDVPSPDQFYGFSGTDKLSPFLQWVYVPAVKDAASEQTGTKNTAIEKLINRAVKGVVKFDEKIGLIRQEAETKYQTMLTDNTTALTNLQDRLTTRMQSFAHPAIKIDLSWGGDSSAAVRISEPVATVKASEFSLDPHAIARCGHGVQRSYIFALLQELASSETPDAPTLLLGIEEPELYQHPPQARHLASVLRNLSKQHNQVLITTHSPFFVSAESFEAIRLVQRSGGVEGRRDSDGNVRVGFSTTKGCRVHSTSKRSGAHGAHTARTSGRTQRVVFRSHCCDR